MQDYINWLQRYIIVHSVIYYTHDDNFISDREYDAKSKELVAIKEAYPEEWKNSEYYKQFGDEYCGNTGFDLTEGLTERQQRIIELIIMGMYHSRNGKPIYAIDKKTGKTLFKI